MLLLSSPTMVLVLLIGREVSNLEIIKAAVKEEDFDVIAWSGMGEKYDTLQELCEPKKPDLICVGAGMPMEIRDKILDTLSQKYEAFNLPEVPKYAYLKILGPDEAPETIKKIMQSGDEEKIQEIKDKGLGPFGTPKFIMESVAKFQRGEFN